MSEDAKNIEPVTYPVTYKVRLEDGTTVTITQLGERHWDQKSGVSSDRIGSKQLEMSYQPQPGTVMQVGDEFLKVIVKQRQVNFPNSIYSRRIKKPDNLEELRQQGKLVVVSP